jgi:hypothetical protein
VLAIITEATPGAGTSDTPVIVGSQKARSLADFQSVYFSRSIHQSIPLSVKCFEGFVKIKWRTLIFRININAIITEVHERTENGVRARSANVMPGIITCLLLWCRHAESLDGIV